jgi:hypothetical protein
MQGIAAVYSSTFGRALEDRRVVLSMKLTKKPDEATEKLAAQLSIPGHISFIAYSLISRMQRGPANSGIL